MGLLRHFPDDSIALSVAMRATTAADRAAARTAPAAIALRGRGGGSHFIADSDDGDGRNGAASGRRAAKGKGASSEEREDGSGYHAYQGNIGENRGAFARFPSVIFLAGLFAPNRKIDRLIAAQHGKEAAHHRCRDCEHGKRFEQSVESDKIRIRYHRPDGGS
jgi:hypothetical protein